MTPARAGPVDAAPLPPRRPTDLRIPPAVVSAGEAEANGDADDPLLKTPTLGAPPSPSLYRPDPDYVDPLVTLAPTPASLSALVYSRGEDGRQLRPSMQQVVTEPKLREVFTRAYLRAASSGDGDLLEWLLAKPSASPSLTAVPARPSPRVGALSTPRIGTIGSPPLPPPQRILKPGEAKKWIDLDAKDDDGSPAVVLAAAFGHTEAIRAIIDGCGRGCIDSKDASGWTALHWASRNGDFTIVSYLLNHGASTDIVSYSGLPDSTSVNSINGLSRAGSSSTLASDFTTASTESSRRRARGLRPYDLAGRGPEADSVRHIISMVEQTSLSRPGSPASASAHRLSRDLKGKQKAANPTLTPAQRKWMDAALDAARMLDLDFTRLGLGPDKEDEDAQVLADADGSDSLGTFDWEGCEPDQMLVISPTDLGALFDAAISDVDPVRQRTERIAPANTIFLAARYAMNFGPVDLLDDLLLGAVGRIEEAVHGDTDSMANLAFWLFNCIALLCYLKRDKRLDSASTEYQLHLIDLINEIFVYVIRDTERRIDRTLDASMLDHESLPGFDDIDFEGEGWSIVKTLTGKRSRMFSAKYTPPSAFDPPSPRIPSATPSPSSSPPKFDSSRLTRTASSGPASPRDVTRILSATLFILNCYDVHASIISQVFSQVFYWLSCEWFNRILSRRKHLCRSKAVQIRLNVTALEDWVRSNRLPIKIFTQPFAPLNHLLQWLQCLSGEQTMDGLFGTMGTLVSLNPLQMLKASREYRFEVGETRMSEECRQHLIQEQQDWDRMRIQKSIERAEKEQAATEMLNQNDSPAGSGGSGSPMLEAAMSPEIAATTEATQQAIDAAFGERARWNTFVPPAAPRTLTELLDPRFMLPFALPSNLDPLLHTRPEERFGPNFSAAAVSQLPSAVPSADTSLDLSQNDEEPAAIVPSVPSSFFERFDVARARRVGSEDRSFQNGAGLGLGLGQ